MGYRMIAYSVHSDDGAFKSGIKWTILKMHKQTWLSAPPPIDKQVLLTRDLERQNGPPISPISILYFS